MPALHRRAQQIKRYKSTPLCLPLLFVCPLSFIHEEENKPASAERERNIGGIVVVSCAATGAKGKIIGDL